jgi:hypothetical protein
LMPFPLLLWCLTMMSNAHIVRKKSDDARFADPILLLFVLVVWLPVPLIT